MRLVTYETGSAAPRTAAERDGALFDLQRADAELPADMLALLNRWEELQPRLAGLATDERSQVRGEYRLLPPVLRPGKILCIGLNYRDHAAETGAEAPKWPEVFAKFATALTGDKTNVVMPAQSEQLDHEVELCAVIGKRGRNISRHNAAQYIAGYTVLNDISVRDMQKRSRQWTMGKNFDTHAPCGPVLVTADEVGDPQSLALSLKVNGDVRQQSNTSEMIFPVYELVEYLSQAMTLEPGDLITTGTPHGVGMGRKPPLWLKVGDVMEATIDRVGTLTNTVVAG